MAALPVGNTLNERLQGLSNQRFDTPEQVCAELAKIFSVRRDEVALLRLQGRMLHFIYPAQLIPIVEVCGGPQTLPEVVQWACDMLKAAGQTPAVMVCVGLAARAQ